MTKRTCFSAIGIACSILFLAAGSASAEIIRCADNAGSTTFTNAACITDSYEVKEAPSAIAAPISRKVLALQKKFLAAEKARSMTALNNISGEKKYSVDQMTVRGAKAAMDILDIASDLARQQASAEKALHVNRWAFWRL